jgi:site-specific DNA-adenine methylase
MVEKLESPYPYFGGKSKVAPIIWDILGNVDNYVEPFMGSGIILLSRPHEPKQETVNDFDCFVANFWRSVKYNAEAVAEHCDWPVNETDLIARHNRLVQRRKEMSERMMREPYYFDAEVAGWWVWVVCNWVGGGYCVKEVEVKMPAIIDRGILTDNRIKNLYSIFDKLKNRLRLTHVACGDWSRVCTPTITHKRGITGVVLDPPYGEGSMDYSVGGNKDQSVAKEVQRWAVENGDNPNLRIIYCGYEGQFTPPPSWRIVEWKAQGGYGSGKGTAADVNSYRERLWLSPHCLEQKQNLLFGDLGKAVIPKSVELKIAARELNNGTTYEINNVVESSSKILENSNTETSTSNSIDITSNNVEEKNSIAEDKAEKQNKEQSVETIKAEESKIEQKEVVCICSEEEPDFGCLVHFPENAPKPKIEEEPKGHGLAKAKDLPPKGTDIPKPIQKGLFE